MGFLSDTFSGVVNAVTGNYFNKKQQKKQNEYNTWLWGQQNAYNTPAAQMERLKEAGLNPMLVYGNGSVVGNTASSAHASGPVAMSGIDLGLGKTADRALKKQQNEFAAKRLNQDLQLGQAQIDQVRTNTDLAAAGLLKVLAETKEINRRIENTPSWLDTRDHSPALSLLGLAGQGVSTFMDASERRRHKLKVNKALREVSDRYDPALPALGGNYRR